MTLALCWLRIDAASAMVRKILDFKGLDYTLVDAAEDLAAQSPAPSANLSAGADNQPEGPAGREYPPQSAAANPAGVVSPIPEQLPVLTVADGNMVVGARAIVDWLETHHPEPSLLPPSHAGLHRTLARYFEGEFGAVILRAAMPRLLEHYRARGERALTRYVTWIERRIGAGFCARAGEHAEATRALARELLAGLEDELSRRAFVLGRIGLADFALYAQLCAFAAAGKLELPADFDALREHFLRIERITAHLQAE